MQAPSSDKLPVAEPNQCADKYAVRVSEHTPEPKPNAPDLGSNRGPVSIAQRIANASAQRFTVDVAFFVAFGKSFAKSEQLSFALAINVAVEGAIAAFRNPVNVAHRCAVE